jgi:S1-C subfamily serine protease
MSSPDLSAEDSAIHSVLEAAQAIVGIQSETGTVLNDRPKGFFDKDRGRFFMIRKAQPMTFTRSGAGLIIHPAGIIVTNAHTVQQAGLIHVQLHDESQLEGKLVQLFPDQDLAFIQITPPYPLHYLVFIDSDRVRIGTNVYTVAHSTILSGSLNGGQISGLALQHGKKEGEKDSVAMLQVNFGLYQGDSGCPVLDEKGKLLGLVSAARATHEKVTYAIPSNIIKHGYETYLASADSERSRQAKNQNA